MTWIGITTFTPIFLALYAIANDSIFAFVQRFSSANPNPNPNLNPILNAASSTPGLNFSSNLNIPELSPDENLFCWSLGFHLAL